ncbi:hypothetical protein EV143_11812 [Flavobacterium chryseum]|uniref:hypothetical protein n=1 Tax=Flavobacterium sp. P3160 TaxID=2512113 RepID=UPI00105C8480|nr:hypothetical protein [Flavobacterium sp. P3160]TDO68828.1 hypothetical protein EV143_11812 [Flavobacterium sp. P3160]
MSTKYFNSLPNFKSTDIKVDRENGILKNTCIANFGENKNDSFFDEKFIQDLVTQGNESERGIKSRFGHPNMCATSFGTYIGRYKNFSVQNGNCFADLFLDPITKKTQVEGKGITMFDYIMDMAESNPDMFGNSIHILSSTFDEKVGDKNQTLHLLDKFKACDLVDDPAATDSLFSSNPNDLGVVVTNFLDENPSLFESINKNPKIIEDFFERYFNYQNRKSLNNFNMSFLDNLKKKFSTKDGSFDIDVTLADGSIVKVITEAEKPKVDDKVVDDAGTPVKDDTHLLPDGSAIVTVGGVITEIKDAPESEETEEPTLSEVMNGVNTLATSFASFKKKFENTQKYNESAFELISEQVQKFDKRVDVLGKSVKSTYEAPPAETKDKKKTGTSTYDADAVREAREAIKTKKTK